MLKIFPRILMIFFIPFFVPNSYGDAPPAIEEIEVVGTTARSGMALEIEDIPALVQSLDMSEYQSSHLPALGDVLSRRMSGVTLTMVQNNPLQSDLQFRGYTASPLLGLPQGIALYQNGVRVTAPFGLLGEPDEVLGDDFENPVFLSQGAPRAAWLGIRVRFD